MIILSWFIGTSIIPNVVQADSRSDLPPESQIVTISPNPALVDSNVSFLGAGYDPDDYTKYFSWDFNGDGTYEILNVPVSGNDWVYQLANYSYSSPGVRTVTLRVSDDEGSFFTSFEDILIVQVTLNIENNYVGVKTNFTADVVGFPGGPEGLLYYWVFGDGTVNKTTNHNIEHIYNSERIYYGWVNITSIDEGSVKFDFSVNITSPMDNPERPIGPTLGKINSQYSYITNTTDFTGDQIYYLWDWGDESNSSWMGPFPSGAIANATHQWTTEGNYEIKVKAKNTHGYITEWSEPYTSTIVCLQSAFFLGTFTNVSQTDDLIIVQGGTFIVFPSDSIIYQGQTIVISRDYLGYLGTALGFGIGGVAIL